MIKNLIKYIFSFLQTLYLFESKKNIKLLTYKNITLRKFNSINTIKDKNLKKYLIKEKKIQRFNNNCKLFVLFYKKNIVSIGWMYEGKTWYIEEVKKKITIKNKILLFDYKTFEKYQKKGFYVKILNLIKNMRTKKIFLIYCLKSNKASVKGIINSNFSLKKII